MKNWKGFFAVYTAAVLFLSLGGMAKAASLSYNSIAEEDDVWIEIADFKELRRIMNSSIRPQTRHIRLTGDITVTGGEDDIYYIISTEYAPIYIDTGEYTIYVEGCLEVLGNASIFGKGGDEGLLHIRKGGYADIQGASLKAKEGYAIWQEDGAFFCASDFDESTSAFSAYSCEGECRYPDKPVVWQSYEESEEEVPYRIVLPEAAFTQEMLPTELFCSWCEQGNRREGKLPVYWETEEETGESLGERKRTLVKGNFGTEYDAARLPECMLIFQNKNAAAIIKGELTIYAKDLFILELDFVLDNYEEDSGRFYMIFSEDGEVWRQSVRGEYGQRNGITYYYEEFEDGSHPPVYFCVCVEKDGRFFYSDMVMIAEDDTLVIGDIQGGRGGGTPVLPGLGKTEPEDVIGTENGAENGTGSKEENGTENGAGSKEENGAENDAGNKEENGSENDAGNKEENNEESREEDSALEYPRMETLAPDMKEGETVHRGEEQNTVTEGEEILSGKSVGASAGDLGMPKTEDKAKEGDETESNTWAQADAGAIQAVDSWKKEGENRCLLTGASGEKKENSKADTGKEEAAAENGGTFAEQMDRERKRQVFMGFGSVGIIMAAVFAGNAFFRRRSRQ